MAINGNIFSDHEEHPGNSRKSCDIYRYKVFGIPITSDFLLPELLPTDETLDAPLVSIRLGKVSANIPDPIEKNEYYQVAKNQFLLRVPGVGSYYVTNGNSILVNPAEQAEKRAVRLFLLGTAFGALLLQRGILPIHGSAVVINGHCVIFTGASGAGKSTLLAAFRERGYSFLTDDVAAVTIDEAGVAWVHPSYPQQKLWGDITEIMGIETTSLTPFCKGIANDKFALQAHKGFCQSPVPLLAVYELEVGKCKVASLQHISNLDKLAVIMSHTYRPWLINGLNIKETHFKVCVAIARQVAVSCLTRPEGLFALEEQLHLVEQDFAQYFQSRRREKFKRGLV